jgi:hypothetical protein
VQFDSPAANPDQSAEGGPHRCVDEQAGEPATSWPIGTLVQVLKRPSYLKTADPMPMLRPPDLIGVDEVGQVVDQRAFGQLAVRFRRGTFLVAADACAPIST